jgi:hypothetical protein
MAARFLRLDRDLPECRKIAEFLDFSGLTRRNRLRGENGSAYGGG